MAKRVCIEAGCPIVSDNTRCPAHTRAKDKARGTRQQRGYDNDHDRLRAAWQRILDSGAVIRCWRPDCDKPINPKHWHLGHDDHDRTITRGPECVACNLSAAGTQSHPDPVY